MLKNPHIRTHLWGKSLDYLDTQDRSLFALPETQYRFTIIGTGMIGMEHIRVTLLEGRATIQGIYDPNPKSQQAAGALFQRLRPQEQLITYTTLEKACRDPAADALIICTPNHTHLEILRVAIGSGKPILLEKPMAPTLQDAKEIWDIGRNYSSFIQVGLQYRYKAIYQEALLETQDRRSIGELKTIAIQEHRPPFLDKVGQWNKFRQYSGGTLVEKCCHYFDLFNLFAASRPVVVSAIGDRAVNFTHFKYRGLPSDIIDHALVNISYENGVKAHLNLCMFAPLFHEEVVLCGAEGRIRAFESEDYLAGKKIQSGFEMRCANERPARTSVPEYYAIIQESGHSGATFFEHVAFIEQLQGQRTQSATLEEGWWSVVVGVAAQEAVESGKPVIIEELLQRHHITP